MVPGRPDSAKRPQRSHVLEHGKSSPVLSEEILYRVNCLNKDMEGEITWRIDSYFEFLAKANASRCSASLLAPEAFELPGATLPVPEP
jgi:hypothetical protein